MPTPQEDILAALFAKVHELQADPVGKRTLALEIQEELIRRMSRAEYDLRRFRASMKATKGSLGQRGRDKAAAMSLKARFARLEEMVEARKSFISTLRAIGDSIAFIYGARFDLKQFAFRESPGWITGKEGVRLERRILREAFRMGATAILNDLTHTLRHGDIAVFRPDRQFLLLEVKSGRGGSYSRAERQKSAATAVFDYIKSDSRAANGGTWHRIEAASDPEHHFAAATRLAKSLPARGWTHEEVEPGLHYVAIDCAIGNADFARIFRPLGDGRVFYLLCVNEMKKARLGYYPLPLCFRDAKVLSRFYRGEFLMYVGVEIDQVNKMLAGSGLAIEQRADDFAPWVIRDTTKTPNPDEGSSFVTSAAIGRLAAEFQRLDWLVTNIIAGPLHDAMKKALAEKRGT